MGGFFVAAASSRKRSPWFLLAFWMAATPAFARTWEVGPTRALTGPAQAAAVAKDGDRVVFDPGVYRECAIWQASRLTIEARQPPVTMNQTVMSQTVVTGPTCMNRGLFVFNGNDITVRGMTIQGARSFWHNGAGILMEGANLTVDNSRIVDNEDGILVGGPPTSTVRITRDFFQGNGACTGSCAHALYVGRVARLEVVGCVFLDTHVAHDIKSRARTTIVHDNRIEDGATGTSSYLIELPDGGNGVILNNVLRKGVNSENKSTAISIGTEDETNPTQELVIRGNRFTSDLPEPVRFVRNSTQTLARLVDNTLIGAVIPLEGPGTVTAPDQ
jgi:Right handed beta helix region